MTAAKHTPGPWFISSPGGKSRLYVGPLVIQSHRTAFPHALVPMDQIGDDELYANARLIAAAPDLLEALIECLSDDFDTDEPNSRTTMIRERARAAIAKAAGVQS